jgi:hypothetical protein
MVEGHRFRDKTPEGFWMVDCFETGGSFSTKMWANESCPIQTCPCCKKVIRKSKANTNCIPIKEYRINDEELRKIINFCKNGKDKDLEKFIKELKSRSKK